MIKSIAGKYRGVVAMVPVVNINADILYSIWIDVMAKVEKIGFHAAVTMSDGHSSNVTFFNRKLLEDKNDFFRLMESGRK